MILVRIVSPKVVGESSCSYGPKLEVRLVCCRKGTAEELPFPDGSVDLLTASTAAHWFDQSRFLVEAKQVLKPRGCIALLNSVAFNTIIHYKACGERLTHIYKQVDLNLPEIKNSRSDISL